jgi:hypothetical protein
MARMIPTFLLGAGLLGACSTAWMAQDNISLGQPCRPWTGDPSPSQIIDALGRQGIRINMAEAQGVRENVLTALREARTHGLGNSKVDFSAVEIAHDLNLDTSAGSSTERNVVAALGTLMGGASPSYPGPAPHPRPLPVPPSPPSMPWHTYFNDTVNLWNQSGFMNLMGQHSFFPVKISWEDIGRYENSVWGDRISDVGIWVRQDEHDASSARLALSVRRDSNFRDKVLMVPSERIKIHVKEGGRTVEKTLPQRLAELGLASHNRDRNVVVSNQFAIVPVPAANMRGAWSRGTAPRSAFTFSIFPYGSTNFVITDVIEGSHEAVVGPGTHQELFANIGGLKAPFTASRAEDRPDLLRLERDLKAQGMDVDVQRYYLIQVPLRRDAPRIQTSNMGTPPLEQAWNGPAYVTYGGVAGRLAAPLAPMPGMASGSSAQMEKQAELARSIAGAGLDRVAIGHGDAEGHYFMGAGYRGARAEEPIRVTVVYFVTPVGRISTRDLETFTRAFAQWDSQAIWGGSFVTKETN